MIRLDNFVAQSAGSRTKAQALIEGGFVSVNGEVIIKSSHKVDETKDKVKIDEHKDYVSRAAFKLSAFLEELGLDISGVYALDIGASTGGFTQVLLEAGASEVDAVDVGKEQLHPLLLEDARVHSFESCDIREFDSAKTYPLVVSDVSFISLHNILDDVDRLACEKIILLFKPQFEVGREAKRDRNGVVQDDKAITKAMIHFEDACAIKGWKLMKKSPSKITGKEGNLEYCYYFTK